MQSACNACSAVFDITGKEPGKVFRCPKCGEGRIEVPEEELEELEELEVLEASDEAEELEELPVIPPPAAPDTGREMARSGAPSPRSSRGGGTGGRRKTRSGTKRTERGRPREKKAGGPPRILLIGVPVVIVAAVLAWYLESKNDSPEKTDPGGTPVVNDSSNPSGGGNSPAGQNPKDTYRERRAALKNSDADGRVELATFCENNSLGGYSHNLYREALLIDPDNEAARAALGFTRYQGAASHYQNRWLSEDDLALAREEEKFVSGGLGTAATSADVFMREAETKKRLLAREFPEDRWAFFYGEGEMRQPFLVLVEKDTNANIEELRQEYEGALGTLKDAFFGRYGEQFSLDEMEAPAVVIIFDSKKSYSKHRDAHPELNYADPEFLGGYYQPWSQRLILWRQRELNGVLLHEGAHMLIHYAFSGRGFEPSNQTPWFQEGFAEFFGGHKVEIKNGKKTYVLGQRLKGRENELAFAESQNARLPILQLLKVSNFQFESAKKDMGNPQKTGQEKFEASMIVTNVYAEGWAFIMYLNYADGGKYRDIFDRYFEAETKGGGHWGTVGELLNLETDEDWAELDRRFLLWTQTTLRKL